MRKGIWATLGVAFLVCAGFSPARAQTPFPPAPIDFASASFAPCQPPQFNQGNHCATPAGSGTVTGASTTNNVPVWSTTNAGGGNLTTGLPTTITAPSSQSIILTNGSNLLDPSLVPAAGTTTLGGVKQFTAVTNNFLTSLGGSGVFVAAQPSCGNLSNSGTGCSATLSGANGVTYSAGTISLSNISANSVPANASASPGPPTTAVAYGTSGSNTILETGGAGTIAASTLPNPSASTLGGIESFLAVSHQWINQISTSGVPSATQPACGDLSNGATGCSTTVGTLATQNSTALNVTGVTQLTGLPSPTNPSDAATKSYVDSSVTASIVWHTPVSYATAAILPNSPTYNNGASGVGATLTDGSTGSVLSIDGQTGANTLNTRVLVQNQASAFQNGIYSVTTSGVAATTKWVLTRVADFNTAAAGNIALGAAVLVTVGGTANVAGTAFVMNQTAAITVGVTALTWAQNLAGGNTYTASNGITLSGTNFVLSNIAANSVPANASGSPGPPTTAVSYGTVGAANTIAETGAGGTLASSFLPNPSASTIGGIESFVAVSHQWINAISTSGVPSATQPACGDLSNSGTGCSATLSGSNGVTYSAGNFSLTPIAGNSVLANSTGGSAAPTSAVSYSATAAANTIAETGAGGTLAAGFLPVPTVSTLGGVESITCAANQFLNVISGAGAPSCAAVAFSGLTGTATLSQLPLISQNTVLGSVTSGSNSPVALSQTQLTSLINLFTSTLSGAVPASGGGTANVLRADGAWVAQTAIGLQICNPVSGASYTLAYTSSAQCGSGSDSNGIIPVTGGGTITANATGASYFPSGALFAVAVPTGDAVATIALGAGASWGTSGTAIITSGQVSVQPGGAVQVVVDQSGNYNPYVTRGPNSLQVCSAISGATYTLAYTASAQCSSGSDANGIIPVTGGGTITLNASTATYFPPGNIVTIAVPPGDANATLVLGAGAAWGTSGSGTITSSQVVVPNGGIVQLIVDTTNGWNPYTTNGIYGAPLTLTDGTNIVVTPPAIQSQSFTQVFSLLPTANGHTVKNPTNTFVGEEIDFLVSQPQTGPPITSLLWDTGYIWDNGSPAVLNQGPGSVTKVLCKVTSTAPLLECLAPVNSAFKSVQQTATFTAPASTSAYTMAGLSSGVGFVAPLTTGQVIAVYSGSITGPQGTPGAGISLWPTYSSGTSGPANGAILQGTQVGVAQSYQPNSLPVTVTTTANLAASTTYFLPIMGTSGANTTEVNGEMAFPYATTLSGLYCASATALGSGHSAVATMRTAATYGGTVASGNETATINNATPAQDTTHTDAIVANGSADIQIAVGASATSSNYSCSVNRIIANTNSQFSIATQLPNLIPGSTYWTDLAQEAIGQASNYAITNVTVTLFEVR